jgi:MFS family permease
VHPGRLQPTGLRAEHGQLGAEHHLGRDLRPRHGHREALGEGGLGRLGRAEQAPHPPSQEASTATAAGAILGSQLASAISRRIGPRAALLLAVAGLAPAYAAIGLTASGALVAAAYLAEGFLILLWNVITVSLRQQVVPETVLGRVNSVYQLLVHGATPLGSLAGGGLVAAADAVAGRGLGLRAPFLLTAVAMVALLAVAARLVTTARVEAATPAP